LFISNPFIFAFEVEKFLVQSFNFFLLRLVIRVKKFDNPVIDLVLGKTLRLQF